MLTQSSVGVQVKASYKLGSLKTEKPAAKPKKPAAKKPAGETKKPRVSKPKAAKPAAAAASTESAPAAEKPAAKKTASKPKVRQCGPILEFEFGNCLARTGLPDASVTCLTYALLTIQET